MSFHIEKKGDVYIANITMTAGALGAFTAYETAEELNGILCSVTTIPSAVTAPQASYDIVITDENGRNICGDTGTGASPNEDGVLADRSATATEYTKFPVNGCYDCILSTGKLTINIANNNVVGAIVTIKIGYFGSF